MNLLTQRLLLRSLAPIDKASIYEYRSDSETNKYQGWIPKTLDEVEEFIAKIPNFLNEPDTWYQIGIIEKESNILVGDIGIHFLSDNEQVEIGCTLMKMYHGKGYATEALKGIIDYIFKVLKKHRIIASVDPNNKSSMKLLNRLNFRQEGHFIESLFFKGEWVDDVTFAILNREWI